MSVGVLDRDRLSLRIAPENKRRIEEAARLRGQTLTDFVVATLTDRADAVIRENTAWVLTQQDFEAFIDAIENPPEPTQALVDLFREGMRREREGQAAQ